MKTFLLFEKHDFASQKKLPDNGPNLIQDLELETLCDAMALNDKFLFEVAMDVVLSGFYNDVDTILYRQGILKDCLKNPSVIREIYNISVEAIENRRKTWSSFYSKHPSSILSNAINLLKIHGDSLKKLKKIADEHASKFESKGLIQFFSMIKIELDDEYFAKVQKQLEELDFPNGALIGAQLGRGNKGTHYHLRKPPEKQLSWLQSLIYEEKHVHTFYINQRDESGMRALSELKDEGVNLVANALAQSADHILSFFTMLRTEMAFYIGCLNLHDQLVQLGKPTAFPKPDGPKKRKHSFKELYDVCLALTLKQEIVGNDLKTDNKNLILITGANQGGKSTFLRSIGLSQLMMQCGMFVTAESFSANICDSLFTHYKREEDTTMESGKLDEELERMSVIVDHITSNSIVLFNESFAATNEHEGSEIAKQIVSALLEIGIKMFFVTHLFEFAHYISSKKMENTISLRAVRGPHGRRTYKLVVEEPLQTSFGVDLYKKIFMKNGLKNK